MKTFAIASLFALLVAGTNVSAKTATKNDVDFLDAFFDDVVAGVDGDRKLRGRGRGRGSGAADRTFSDFACADDAVIVACATRPRRRFRDPDADDTDTTGSVACFEKTNKDGEVVKRNICVGNSVPNHPDGTPPTINCGCCEGSCADVFETCTTECPDDPDKVLVTDSKKEICVTPEMAITFQLKTKGRTWACV